eukprot:COSAG01_NODE_2854_length_6967_cov_27.753058_6_plen_103_part_00
MGRFFIRHIYDCSGRERGFTIMLIDSQGCRNTAIVLVLFVERVRVSLDLSFVAKLATALRQDCFCTPPVLATVPVPVRTAVRYRSRTGTRSTTVLVVQLYGR